jgi:hypothetical protein
MIRQHRRLSGLIICGALLLTACTSPAASESTAQPAAMAERAVQPAQPTVSAPTQVYPLPTTGSARGYPAPPAQPPASPTTEPPTDVALPAEPTLTPLATPAPLAVVQGEVVLRLGVGDPQGSSEATNIKAPRALRIGGDGTIRVLDQDSRRVLFFSPNGQLGRVLNIEADSSPIDFIVNTQGEAFILDRSYPPEVLRYSPAGKLLAKLPVSIAAVGDSIALTTAQDLILIQSDQLSWAVESKGVAVPPEIQPLTQQQAIATPRSPTLFQTVADSESSIELRVIGLTTGATGAGIGEVTRLRLPLPMGARFFNVDRAMNLYFAQISPNLDMVDLWRVLPDGTIAGGARLAPGCQLLWRTFYIDQAGAAWTLCANGEGVTVTRYLLRDTNGEPLPEVAQDAADVLWRPGRRLDAA